MNHYPYYVWLDQEPETPIIGDTNKLTGKDEVVRLCAPVIGFDDQNYATFVNPLTGQINSTRNVPKPFSLQGVVDTVLTLKFQLGIEDDDIDIDLDNLFS